MQKILSVWFLITIFGPAIAGFLGPGSITLGVYFGGILGGVDGDFCWPEDRY